MAAVSAVITGAGSGIGRALARELAAHGHDVIAIGRHEDTLKATAHGHNGITPLAGDVGDPTERARIAHALSDRHLGFVVHNAGRLEPVGDLAKINLAEWRKTMAVNVEAPLFLTQALLELMSHGARVLHVSSGAAHRPTRGWGAYCATKASSYMVYRLLADELAQRGIAVGSLRPGVVDTPMQTHIRSLAVDQFPDVERFRALKRDGLLVAPEDVARFAYDLLVATSQEQFTRAEWDIREHWETFR
jgi:NAD(P)-dependent dehydrogenase (short-subunit alcohol dehydrogenase family)